MPRQPRAGTTLWVLFDLDNGHNGAQHYLWYFETRAQARAHRASQARDYPVSGARLSVPVKVQVLE